MLCGCEATPRSKFAPPWRMDAFFGEGDELDVLSQQTSGAYGAQWDRRTQLWLRTCVVDSMEGWFTSAWDEQLNCWTGERLPRSGSSQSR